MHQAKTGPAGYFAAVFRCIFRKRGIASQGNIYKLPTQRAERPDVGDLQAGTIHQMYGPAHEKLDSTTPAAEATSIGAAHLRGPGRSSLAHWVSQLSQARDQHIR